MPPILDDQPTQSYIFKHLKKDRIKERQIIELIDTIKTNSGSKCVKNFASCLLANDLNDKTARLQSPVDLQQKEQEAQQTILLQNTTAAAD